MNWSTNDGRHLTIKLYINQRFQSLVEPDSNAPRDTILFLPSLEPFSTASEWSNVADSVSSFADTVIVEWPGWSSTSADVNRAFVSSPTPSASWEDFLSQILPLFSTLHIASLGASGAILAHRAAQKHPEIVKSLISVAPFRKRGLLKQIGDDYPVKLARRQKLLFPIFSLLGRFSAFQRLYLSDLMLNRMTERLFNEPLTLNPERLKIKRTALTRPGCPFEMHVASWLGLLHPGASSPLTELLGPSAFSDGFDTDDEDDFLFGRTMQKKTGKTSAIESRPLSAVAFIIPSDCIDDEDVAEMQEIFETSTKLGVSVSRVPGRLFCHEEYPIAVANAIRDTVSNPSVCHKSLVQDVSTSRAFHPTDMSKKFLVNHSTAEITEDAILTLAEKSVLDDSNVETLEISDLAFKAQQDQSSANLRQFSKSQHPSKHNTATERPSEHESGGFFLSDSGTFAASMKTPSHEASVDQLAFQGLYTDEEKKKRKNLKGGEIMEIVLGLETTEEEPKKPIEFLTKTFNLKKRRREDEEVIVRPIVSAPPAPPARQTTDPIPPRTEYVKAALPSYHEKPIKIPSAEPDWLSMIKRQEFDAVMVGDGAKVSGPSHEGELSVDHESEVEEPLLNDTITSNQSVSLKPNSSRDVLGETPLDEGVSSFLELLRGRGLLKADGRQSDDVVLEHRDKHGRVLGPREAYKELSWRFHGTRPSKKRVSSMQEGGKGPR